MTQASPLASASSTLLTPPADTRCMNTGTRTDTERKPITRRPTVQQGFALEILGHGIEYLVDTNFYDQRSDVPAVKDAIAILKQSNREVFAESPEVLPAGARAMRWLRSHRSTPALTSKTTAHLVLVKR